MENPDRALQLAQKLLNAKTEEEATSAFTDILDELNTEGIEDPEELLKAKLESQMNTYAAKVGIKLAGFKRNFKLASRKATTEGALKTAYDTAKTKASDFVSESIAAMKKQLKA